MHNTFYDLDLGGLNRKALLCVLDSSVGLRYLQADTLQIMCKQLPRAHPILSGANLLSPLDILSASPRLQSLSKVPHCF